LPQDIAQFVDRINIPPDWNNKYLQGVVKEGMKRVKTKLAQDYRDGVLSWMRIMAREGHNPLYIAKWLHNEYEGKAWYWNRLARSESALALNAGYDSWADEANVLYDEWSAAGDACLICAAFDGQVWKRGEGAEPVSDTHPHSVQKFTRVFTSNGWEPIYKINIGDLVLTHTGKFKKVTELHRHTEYDQDMVELIYKNEPYAKNRNGDRIVSLKLSDNHPIYLNGEWLEAKYAKAGDKIAVLANKCECCGKLIVYSRWRNTRGDKTRFCSLECSSKMMDKWTDRPKSETEAIRNKISKYKKQHNPMHDYNIVQRMAETKKIMCKDPEYLKKLSASLSKFHFENPGFAKNVYKKYRDEDGEKYKKDRKKQSDSLRKYWKENPDKHPNIKMVNVSKPQRALFELVKKYYNNAELEVPIKTNYGIRYADIVLKNNGLILEYDGEYWHRDKEKDLQRDFELQFCGWTVLHFNDDNWETAPFQIKNILKNHNNEYDFIEIELSDIKKYKLKRVDLYNLAVDTDESYIAKGFVVHNCRCLRVPKWITEGKRVNPEWIRPSPYDVPYIIDRENNTIPELSNLFG